MGKNDKTKATGTKSGVPTNDKLLSPKPAYDKSKIFKGSPSKKKLEKKVRKKLEKEKANEQKKQTMEIPEKNVQPVGKLIKKIPRPPKKDAAENLDSNEEIQGQNILAQDPDPDLESKKESTIVGDDDDTTALDVTLSDTGIKGTKICPIRTLSNETEIDPLQLMVDQCNEENDFGNAR